METLAVIGVLGGSGEGARLLGIGDGMTSTEFVGKRGVAEVASIVGKGMPPRAEVRGEGGCESDARAEAMTLGYEKSAENNIQFLGHSPLAEPACSLRRTR